MSAIREEVPYLGHIVNKEGIIPDPAKTQKVKEYPVPEDQTQLRQFLGLSSYYRQFVPGFAKLASPLLSLLKKDAIFQWTDVCQKAFEKLKEQLVTAPVLAYPEFGDTHSFVLETDASIQGFGAVLAQKKEDGQVHPIAYASRSLQPHEKNYVITELETLELVWAAKHFRLYLLGHPCTVYTDHAACTSLLHSKNPSPKLASWAMIVEELDLDIKHRPGKGNTNADALSHNPVDSKGQVMQMESDMVQPECRRSAQPTEDVLQPSSLEQLQREDPGLSHLFRYLEDAVLPTNEKVAKSLVLESIMFGILDGILYYEHPCFPG